MLAPPGGEAGSPEPAASLPISNLSTPSDLYSSSPGMQPTDTGHCMLDQRAYAQQRKQLQGKQVAEASGFDDAIELLDSGDLDLKEDHPDLKEDHPDLTLMCSQDELDVNLLTPYFSKSEGFMDLEELDKYLNTTDAENTKKAGPGIGKEMYERPRKKLRVMSADSIANRTRLKCRVDKPVAVSSDNTCLGTMAAKPKDAGQEGVKYTCSALPVEHPENCSNTSVIVLAEISTSSETGVLENQAQSTKDLHVKQHTAQSTTDTHVKQHTAQSTTDLDVIPEERTNSCRSITSGRQEGPLSVRTAINIAKEIGSNLNKSIVYEDDLRLSPSTALMAGKCNDALSCSREVENQQQGWENQQEEQVETETDHPLCVVAEVVSLCPCSQEVEKMTRQTPTADQLSRVSTDHLDPVITEKDGCNSCGTSNGGPAHFTQEESPMVDKSSSVSIKACEIARQLLKSLNRKPPTTVKEGIQERSWSQVQAPPTVKEAGQCLVVADPCRDSDMSCGSVPLSKTSTSMRRAQCEAALYLIAPSVSSIQSSAPDLPHTSLPVVATTFQMKAITPNARGSGKQQVSIAVQTCWSTMEEPPYTVRTCDGQTRTSQDTVEFSRPQGTSQPSGQVRRPQSSVDSESSQKSATVNRSQGRAGLENLHNIATVSKPHNNLGMISHQVLGTVSRPLRTASLGETQNPATISRAQGTKPQGTGAQGSPQAIGTGNTSSSGSDVIPVVRSNCMQASVAQPPDLVTLNDSDNDSCSESCPTMRGIMSGPDAILMQALDGDGPNATKLGLSVKELQKVALLQNINRSDSAKVLNIYEGYSRQQGHQYMYMVAKRLNGIPVTYQCPICPRHYARPDIVKNHITNTHQSCQHLLYEKNKPSLTLACTHCDYVGQSKLCVLLHMVLHHKVTFLVQEMEPLPRDSELEVLTTTYRCLKSVTALLACPQCGLAEVKKRLMLRHMKETHRQDHSDGYHTVKNIDLTKTKISGPRNNLVVLSPEQVREQPDLYLCKVCGYSTANKDLMHYHQMEHHSDKSLLFVCDMCWMRFDLYFDVRKHVHNVHKLASILVTLVEKDAKKTKYVECSSLISEWQAKTPDIIQIDDDNDDEVKEIREQSCTRSPAKCRRGRKRKELGSDLDKACRRQRSTKSPAKLCRTVTRSPQKLARFRYPRAVTNSLFSGLTDKSHDTCTGEVDKMPDTLQDLVNLDEEQEGHMQTSTTTTLTHMQPATTAPRQRGTNIGTAATRQRGANIGTAANRQRGANIGTAATRQRGADIGTAAARQRGEDIGSAATRQRGEGIGTAATRQRGEDIGTAATRQRGEDIGTAAARHMNTTTTSAPRRTGLHADTSSHSNSSHQDVCFCKKCVTVRSVQTDV